MRRCGDMGFLKELTDANRFSEVIEADAAPIKGIYFDAGVTDKPISDALETYADLSDPLSILTLGIIRLLPILPVFSSKAGLIIKYDLYVDQELRKTYRYEISKVGLSWIGVLPFAWVNFFTYDQKDACHATFYQFLTDAERDGYLKQD